MLFKFEFFYAYSNTLFPPIHKKEILSSGEAVERTQQNAMRQKEREREREREREMAEEKKRERKI